MTAFVNYFITPKTDKKEKGQWNISGLTQGGFNNKITDFNRQLAHPKF